MPANGDSETVRTALQSGAPGDVRALTVERGGETVELTARLQVLEDPLTGDGLKNPDTGRPLTGLGFTFDATPGPSVSFGPLEGLAKGWDFAWYIVKTNVRVIGDSFVNSQARGQVSSIVGVGATFNEVAGNGLIDILQFIGVISLALGIFNLLPILPLDGGHIVFAIAEKVKGSALQRRHLWTRLVRGLRDRDADLRDRPPERHRPPHRRRLPGQPVAGDASVG